MALPLADEILRRLVEADGEVVSGQELARGFGVTRAAVWKGIEALRADGCAVESLPSRGYRLVAPPGGLRAGEVSARLKTGRLGCPVRHLDSVDSTNREAERWALGGAPEGALVVAEHQTAGRGRLGRSWADSPRRSLLASLILRPSIPPAQAPLLTYAAAVALAQTLSRWVSEDRVSIKWPNDVLLEGRKVAGILLEMKCEAQSIEHVILGVGVNVEGGCDELPDDLRDSATTLAAVAEASPDRLSVLCAFVEAFERCYDEFLCEGFETLRPRWNAWSRMAGRAVRIRTSRGVQEGIALGLAPGGALLLETREGPTVQLFAGDVEFATTRVSP